MVRADRTIRVALTSVGTPLSVSLSRALRDGHEGLRAHVVGLDANPAANGAWFCDAFRVIPRIGDPGFAAALEQIVTEERIEAVIPQTTNDVAPLDAIRGQIGRAHV